MMRESAIALLGFLLAGGVSGSPAQHVVAIDQAGYRPGMPKMVFASRAADSVTLLSAPGNTAVYRAPMALWKVGDPESGTDVYRGVFSSFRTPGRYRAVTSRGDTSFSFLITDTVYSGLLRKSLKAFYFQRCGTELASPFAAPYQHGPCHLIDALVHRSTDSTGFRNTIGGWHDAGDYGKYVVNAGISVGTLLLAYDMFPERFGFDDLGIPESGNGVPDILDEARFELEWFLKMQRGDGGFWFKVTREQFEGFVMPQADTGTRYLYAVSSTATGDATAVLARAARAYAGFDPAFAQRCLSAARLGWGYLTLHPSIVPAGGFTNPAGTATGEYGDGDDSDERLWAAAELFETTGESAFHDAFQASYIFGPLFDSPMWWGNVRPLALLTYIRSRQASAIGSVKTELRQGLAAYCAGATTKRNQSGYQVVLRRGEYVWGSNSSALNAAILLIAGSETLGDTLYAGVASDQLHYVLGVNRLARCYVTGIGSRSPRQIHHRPSAADGVADPVPGLIAGGPNEYLSDPVLQALFTSSTPPSLCYADTVPSYASNEVAINWNAPLVFVAGYFAASPGATAVPPGRSPLPEESRLEQNYPNPFNGSTRIRFAVREAGHVELRVADLLGRVVSSIPMGTVSPGEHEIIWEAKDNAGRPLCSGTYFYYLTGGGLPAARKLVLAK